MTRTTEDPEIEAWTKVVEDLLYRVPPEKRAAVLEKATQKEVADRKEREANGGFKFMTFDKASIEKWKKSPGMRHYHRIQRLKSKVVYAFTRDITNNNRPQDAARILFRDHSNVPGSGWLPEYLDGLPCVKIDRRKAAKLEGHPRRPG